MDKIAEVASTLVGGSTLKSDWGSSGTAMMQKAYGIARAVQERGVNAGNKFLNPVKGKVVKWGEDKAKGAVRGLIDRGKAIAQIGRKKGADSTGSSKQGPEGSDSSSKNGGKGGGGDSGAISTDGTGKAEKRNKPTGADSSSSNA